MTVSSKIRIYDLAKELKLDTKRLIEEVRREGVDVSVPSNSVSKELAEKIRNKYFPKKETAVKRGVRVVKRAERAVEEAPAAETADVAVVAEAASEVVAEGPQPEVALPTAAPDAAKPATTARLLRKLPRAVRAEQPVADSGAPATRVVCRATARRDSADQRHALIARFCSSLRVRPRRFHSLLLVSDGIGKRS